MIHKAQNLPSDFLKEINKERVLIASEHHCGKNNRIITIIKNRPEIINIG